MVGKALLLALASFLCGCLLLAGVVAHGWWTFRALERSIVEKMDQYYLNVTTPGREDYLLQDDEVFEVPYMASKLSASAEPTRIYDRNGALAGEYVPERGVYVRSASELPAFLKKALVATEDRGFYQHKGINWKAVARATLVNLRNMRKSQGGSTLTQQLAKTMFTTRRKTVGRKVFEYFCARKLEEKFTKDQILLMYLNFAYFGHGCYGVESAARFYFDKPARELQIAEAAMLAGLIASPNNYSPLANLELAKARHRTVLRRMAENGFLPADAAERYGPEFWRSLEARLRDPEVSFWRMRVNEAPYFVEAVRRELEKEHTKERIVRGGLRVSTTMDLALQKAAERALRSALAAENASSSGTARVEGALVVLDPRDGAVLAMVGGRGFQFGNQLNRALDIRRPIGSAVKPFIYAAAFESGRSRPEDVALDEPVSYRLAGGRRWAPQNYDGKHHGEVRLDAALARSLNTVAVKLLDSLDIDDVIGLLSKATGREPRRFPRNLSLALGTADLSPAELAGAYALFANGGRPVRPHYILRVEDREGRVLREEPSPALAEAVLSSSTCAALVAALRGVLAEGGTAYWAARRAGFRIPAAGKTGSTNDYRDAWFAGFTPDLAAAVWLGHDDMRVELGPGKTGGTLAAPVWMDFVKEAYRTRPTREFDTIASR